MSDEHLQDDPNVDQDNDQNDGLEGDELKSKLAEDLGLDPDDESQAQILENALKRETRQREITAKAIQQKQKYRKELEAYQAGTGPKPEGNAQNRDVDVKSAVLEILEQRDLQSLSLSEDLEDEVKTLAKLKNISVMEAAKLPYIQSRKQEIEREARISEATPSGNSKGTISKNTDPSKPPLRGNYTSDEEGSKSYNKDLEAYLKRQREK